ncbi:MAG: methylenetetrahydrofolate reductase [Anaerolineales bacterium]|nr:methylenetetrahydrofolate reductase [Anaerolineales bacterium]
MKLAEIWKTKDKPTISFELFPARTEKAAASLEKTIDMLADLQPDFASVTFGAGGSTRDGSYQLLQKLKHEKGLEVLGYFAGVGLSPNEITSVLDSYQSLGIENILVVRGDAPHDQEDFSPHPDSFEHASDMMEFIRPRYDFCLGVAGYPEGHIEAVSQENDLQYLKLKVANGAEYIVTNYAYDNQYFFNFVERSRDAGITVPILPGVMPIYSEKMMGSLASLCGATITEEIRQGLSALPEGDKQAVLDFGIEFAYQQCKGLLAGGVPGVHIYTMDRWKTTSEILRRLRADGIL